MMSFSAPSSSSSDLEFNDTPIPQQHGHSARYYFYSPDEMNAAVLRQRARVGGNIMTNSNRNKTRAMQNAVQVNSGTIRGWLRAGDLERLEQMILDGQGARLLGEHASDPKVRNFIRTVPGYIAKIDLLHDAVARGDLRESQALLDRRKLSISRDQSGLGLLHKAVANGYRAIVEWLVAKYPEILTVKDNDGRLPIHYCGSAKVPEEMLQLLMEAGADPAASDLRGKSAHYYLDHPEELFDGASTVTRYRITGPMRNINSKGLVSSVSAGSLKGTGISHANIRTWIHDRDISRLETVVWEGQGDRLLLETTNAARVKRFLENVPHLLANIKEVHQAAVDGDIDHMVSIKKRLGSLVEVLYAKDRFGQTPLHKAAALGHRDVVDYLVRNATISVHMTDHEGRLPIHMAAAYRDSTPIYNVLLHAGSDERATDLKGKPAEYYRVHPTEVDVRHIKEIPDAPRGSGHFLGWDRSNVRTKSPPVALLRSQTDLRSSSPPIPRPSTPDDFREVSSEHIDAWIHYGDLDNLERLVLEGKGDRLKEKTSWNTEVRDFLNHVPQLMSRMTAVHRASQMGDLNEVHGLVDPEPKLAKGKDQNGALPLHQAALQGHTEILRTLLNAYPPGIAVLDVDKRTPLHYAAMCKNPIASHENYNLLKDAGADETVFDLHGHIAQHYLPEVHIEKSQPPPLDPGSYVDHYVHHEQPSQYSDEHQQLDEYTDDQIHVDDPSRYTDDFYTEDEQPGQYSESSDNPHKIEYSDELGSEMEIVNNINSEKEALLRNELEHELHEYSKDSDIEDSGVESGVSTSEKLEEEARIQNLHNQEISSAHTRSAGKSSGHKTPKDDYLRPRTHSGGNTVNDHNSGTRGENPSASESGFTHGQVLLEEGEPQDGGVEIGKLAGGYMEEFTPEVITRAVHTKNMDRLVDMVLEGQGQALAGIKSEEKEVQAFLDNVPAYMAKIEALHNAAAQGNMRELQTLMDRKQLGRGRDAKGSTPLHKAVLYGHPEIVRYLAAHCPVALTMKDYKGRTPLHYGATVRDGGHIYKILVNANADPNMKDKDGNTPGFYLRNKDHLPHSMLLEEYEGSKTKQKGDNPKAETWQRPPTEDENKIQSEFPVIWNEEGQYLATALGDALIQGLTEVSNRRPEDPIAYLASYLQNYAKENQQTHHEAIVIVPNADLQQISEMLEQPQPAEIVEQEVQDIPMSIAELTTADDEIVSALDNVPPLTSHEMEMPPMQTDAPNPASLEDRDEHGQSVLHYTVLQLNAKNAIYQLLSEGEHVISYRDERYRTARDVALEAGNPENAAAIDSWVLSLAAQGELERIQEMILDGYDHILDLEDDQGNHIIEITEQHGQERTAAFVKGITFFQDQREWIHAAIRAGDEDAVVHLLGNTETDKLLRAMRALAAAKNRFGRNAMHISVLMENQPICQFLATKFPETLHIGDNLERTPLHYAMGLENVEEVTKILIQAGAMRVIKDLKGRQPSYYFMNREDVQLLQEQEQALKGKEL